MLSETEPILQLVYYNCRGLAQYLRYIIYEIGMPFEEVHVTDDTRIHEYLEKLEIKESDLPCIVFEGKVLKELYPSIRFLCRKFDRMDLIGNNLYEQTKISEIYTKLLRKKNYCLYIFAVFANKVSKNPENIKQIKEELKNSFNEVDITREACLQMYSETGNFLFDHLTIADFVLYEHCYYFANMFRDVCRKSKELAFSYKNFFERTKFYQENNSKIEAFPLDIPQFNQETNESIKLMFYDSKTTN